MGRKSAARARPAASSAQSNSEAKAFRIMATL
jgi:hypothetical protein